MLERQDLEMIRLIVREEVGESEIRMTGKITESEERMKSYVGEKITESEERMKSYVGEKIAESEERMKSYVGEKITESEERMKSYVGEKITESEERMKSYVGEKITESEERMKSYVGEKITESEERMKNYIHEEIGHSENRVLGELDRVDMKLSLQMELVKTRMTDISEYYRIRRLDDTNASYLLRLIDGLTRRVDALETIVA